MPANAGDVAAALRDLFAHRQGVLIVNEVIHPVRFIIDGRAGRIITPAPRSVIDHEEGTFFVPDEGEGCVQLHVRIASADPAADGEAFDRWQAYHLRAAAPLWVQLRPMGLRHGQTVLDEGEFDLRNPLAADEPKLCKAANADRPSVVRALAKLGVDEPEPTVVGVDFIGLDVRCRIGIVRIAFASFVLTADAARFELERLMRS